MEVRNPNQNIVFSLILACTYSLGNGRVLTSGCSSQNAAEINECMEPMIKLSESISATNTRITQLIFPLYAFESTELETICDSWNQIHSNCLRQDTLLKCPNHGLYKILKELFGYACEPDARAEFSSYAACIASTSDLNTQCLDFIRASPDISSRPADKCEAVNPYYDCVKFYVEQSCGIDAGMVLRKSVKNFGCLANEPDEVVEPLLGQAEQDTPPPTLATLAQTEKETSVSEQPTSATTDAISTEEGSGSIRRSESSIEADSDDSSGTEEFEESIEIITLEEAEPGECTESKKADSRACLQPVMTLWQAYARSDQKLLNMTFPLLFLSRPELLEVCDQYASSFLDCSLATFHDCQEDEVVRFVDSQFGYACGNAIEFFRNFDCLSVVTVDSERCREHLELEPESTFDNRCEGLGKYYMCVRDTIRAICPAKALHVLKSAMKHYGCEDV